MDLQTLRETALRRYGLDGTVEDEVFTVTKVNQIINEKHKWIAMASLCYYDEFTVDLPANGEVALDDSLIELDLKTVAWKNASNAWKSLRPRTLGSLIEQLGPLQSVAATVAGPTAFILRSGAAAATNRVVKVVPKFSTGAVTSGFYYAGWVTPADMTDDTATDETGTPQLPASLHSKLIAPICWGLAELDRSRGRDNAPVKEWFQRAVDEALELFEFYRRGMREMPRTGNAGETPLEDARARRDSLLRGGGSNG